MDILSAIPYLPGTPPENPGPLERFMPPVQEGIAAAFLSRHAVPSSWVLDPFGALPRLAIEMARLGYRVLTAVNNPVIRFMLEMAARPPTQADLRLALSELASARKGEERLETHLQSLYLTECDKCGRSLPAEAFVWECGAETPFARIYHCPCGESGEHPARESDRQRLSQMVAMDSLHRSRTLERVTARDDPERGNVKQALECYLPRAVYSIITLVNKLEGLDLSSERHRSLTALILTACDEANTLWPHPAERPRPKQLTVPTHFLEKNIWQALERGVDIWSGRAQPVPLVIWPEVPPESGGICLFEGPIRDLAPHLKDHLPQVLISAIPRPNQAFWTLSALWTGWLWGREAVKPFKSALQRRRYDWTWHAAALYAALKNLAPHVPLSAPLFALLAEVEPSFLSAMLLAASAAGFDLHGLALRTVHDPLQAVWYRQDLRPKEEMADADTVRLAMQDYLRARGEPVTYLHLHAAALAARCESHALAWKADALGQIHAPIHAALDSGEFVHYGGSKNLESGLWGLPAWDPETASLPDRVELAVVRFLQERLACSWPELEECLNAELSGLFTPSLGLIKAVLTSYAVETEGRWSLRQEDFPSPRRVDLESASRLLETLADRLGYTATWIEGPDRLLLWQENARTVYAIYLLASAGAGKILRQNPYPPECSLLALPGGRSELLAAKLRRDPALEQVWKGGWRALKFRQLRRLAEIPSMTRDGWEKDLSGDPIEPLEQMKMF